MKKFSSLLLFILLTVHHLSAQDDLSNYSIAQLDKLYDSLASEDRYEEALVYLQKALEKAEKQYGVEDTLYADRLYKIGVAFDYGFGDMDEALNYYNKALEIQRKKSPQSLSYAQTLFAKADVYCYNLQLFDKAIEGYKKTLSIQKTLLGKQHPDYAASLGGLGTAYWYKGDFKKAEPLFLTTAEIYKANFGNNHPNYAEALENLGHLYYELGDQNKAEASFIKALNIYKNTHGEIHTYCSEIYINLGNIYQKMQAYEKAESFYLQSLNITKELNGEYNHPYATVLNNLATLYASTGADKKAESFYIRSLDITKELVGKNHPEYAYTLRDLGMFYKKTEAYQEAKDHLFKAQKIIKEFLGEQHPVYAHNLHNLGLVYDEMGADKKAENAFIEALKVNKNIFGEFNSMNIAILNNLASFYEHRNNLDLAWQNVVSAIKTNSNIAIEQSLSPPTTKALLEANYLSFDAMSRSLFIANKLFAHEKKTAQQRLIIDIALKLLERHKNQYQDEQDKLRILQLSSEWIKLYMKLLDKNKDAATVLSIIEKNKSVLLLDAHSTKQAYFSGLLPDSLIQQEKALEKQYANTKATLAERRPASERDSIRSTLTALSIKMDAFQKTIKENHPKYAAIKYSHDAVDLATIQATLDDKTALLEYLVGNSVVYVLYVDKKQIKIYDVAIHHEKLKQRIQSMHQSLSNYQFINQNKASAYREYTTQAFWFYQNFVAPSLEQAKDIERFIIVPDGELGHLPFESFLVEEAPQSVTDYNALHYLINDFKISYNYSATLWHQNQTNNRRTNNHQVLGVAANYVYQLDSTKIDWRLPADLRMRKALTPLPAARKEIEVLQEKYLGFFAFDTLASEKVFKEKAANFGVIHLAMHGLLNKREQALSSLVFSEVSDSLENNFLHAYEIAQLELNADLVVLSACETGFGKFERGNGIASLARSFMYAGVPAMVVSLWQVNDYATSQIMQNFYTNLTEGMSKDEALQQAKIHYIKSYKGALAHPAFWSPFIMMGNTQPISIAQKGTTNPWLIGGGLLLLILGILVYKKRSKEIA